VVLLVVSPSLPVVAVLPPLLRPLLLEVVVQLAEPAERAEPSAGIGETGGKPAPPLDGAPERAALRARGGDKLEGFGDALAVAAVWDGECCC
jgi:hypothetical protein